MSSSLKYFSYFYDKKLFIINRILSWYNMRLLFLICVCFLKILPVYADESNNIILVDINSEDYINHTHENSEYVFNQTGNNNYIGFISEYTIQDNININQQGAYNISDVNIINSINSDIALSQVGINNQINTTITDGINNNITVTQTGNNNIATTSIFQTNNSQIIILQNSL